MSYENLLVTRDGAVATVTINRPKALNALNSQTVNELLEASHDLEIDPDVRAVILTGAGEKAFVAGADIAEMAEMRTREARHFAELGGAGSCRRSKGRTRSGSRRSTASPSAAAASWRWRVTSSTPRAAPSSASPRSAWA